MNNEISGAAGRLSRAVTFATVSTADPGETPFPKAFSHFEDFLQASFPRVHQELLCEKPGNPGLLYTWTGSNPVLPPLILTAHYDVVPAEDPDTWQYPPFSGEIVDGCIWGRGTIDDKASLMAILESVESLLAAGLKPQRVVYLCFGGDEEVAGTRGAARIASELARRGVTNACLIDEGTAVVHNSIKLVQQPVALIGTAEKGYLDVELVCSGSEGHASMPSRKTAVGSLARALTRLQHRPFPARMLPCVAEFLCVLADAAPSILRPLLRRPRLFRHLLLKALAADPKTDAMIRTTQAPTMLSGSGAPNVLPATARAVINLRLLPGDRIPPTIDRIRRIINDPAVQVQALHAEGANEPVPESPTDTPVYRALQQCIAAVFPDALIAPYLVTSTTDSKHYREVTTAIYRFLPLRMGPNELSMIHARNERISITDYLQMISFYSELIQTASQEII
ncbi:MAG: M20/M25/M40 family metallo-hydrolase [Spirochaeta sp.]